MDNLFIFALQEKGLIMDAIRTLFAYIDGLIYFAISLLFRAIFNLANFDYIKLYEMMEDRIYVILGIFMLFKVTVSLLTYLVNPDRITDKEQGATKLITRIILVLVMLIGLPSFFSIMTEFQNKVLPVIPRVIMGTTTTLNTENVGGVAQDMSMSIFKGFAKPGDGCGADELEDFFDLANDVRDRCPGNRSYYKYEYRSIISTVVGVIVCYMVFSLCISVAIRAFKLIILRMIAPIPVISYIDPKSSKDGAFHHWSKTFMSTWGELFIHLGIIYLIVYIISFIFSSTFWANIQLPSGSGSALIDTFDGTLLITFLIIGLLFFAKSAPQFIFDALGIKSKGGFGKMLGLGAAAAGGIGAARTGYQASRAADDALGKKHGFLNTAKNLGAGLLGGIGGSMAGAQAVMNAKDHHITAGMDAMAKRNATAMARGSAGSTALGRASASMQRFFGGETDYEKQNREKAGYEAANKALLGYKNTLEKKALEKDDLFIKFKDKSGKEYGGSRGINYMEFMAHTEGAKNGNAESLQYFMDIGFSKTIDVEEDYLEEYTETEQVRVEDNGVMMDENGAMVPAYHYETRPVTKTRPAKRTVQKTIADWQGAQSFVDKIKDTQTQKHAERVVAAAENYEKTGNKEVFEKYGTEYNEYRLAVDAAADVNLSVDFTTYGIPGADAENGDTVGVKQALGETNRHITGVVTDSGYKAAKANADATKK